MAEPHVDYPGEITWFPRKGPLPVLGPCPHHACPHLDQTVIAWGPSMDHYELVQCVMPGGCDRSCRSWSDGRSRTTTPWLSQQEQLTTKEPS